MSGGRLSERPRPSVAIDMTMTGDGKSDVNVDRRHVFAEPQATVDASMRGPYPIEDAKVAHDWDIHDRQRAREVGLASSARSHGRDPSAGGCSRPSSIRRVATC